jgi:quercetin dioxygenase-like cupin family protein
VFFARKLMPVILDDTKNPFGNAAPIIGAANTTMFISIMPPGQGPCLHSHNGTYETFMVLEGTIEYYVGDPVEHTVVLNKWDAFSCPPRVYRGFKNIGDTDAVQLTVITGVEEGRDDVSIPDSIGQQVERDFGKEIVEGFRGVFSFDPPRPPA